MTLFTISSSVIFSSLNPAAIIRNKSLDVHSPTTRRGLLVWLSLSFSDGFLGASITIIPDNPPSMTVGIALRIVASSLITGFTQRFACLDCIIQH